MLVEDTKALIRERRGRAQLAGAKRGQRPAHSLNILRGARKSLRQRNQSIETHALDFEAGIGGGTARILKHSRDEPVTAGWKIARRVRHCSMISLFKRHANALGA